MYWYIHIPFCESKCSYCRFASYAWIDKLKVNFYVDFLCREIEKSEIKKEKLKTIYFWGGTPTTLSVIQLEKIIKTLAKKFGLKNNIEINLETTPENVTVENLVAWKKIGINRISMGIQSLNNKTLKEISRKPKKEIFRALEVLSEGIIQNISVDFIIGLPFVKSGEVQLYIEEVLKRCTVIKHVSVYMLEDYYEIAEEKDSKFQNVVYPVNWSKDGIAEELFLDEYKSIKKYLKSQKYDKYEISNFSKTWYECKHNLWYWNHNEVAAFWLWASGILKTSILKSLLLAEGESDWLRYKNSDNFGDYYKSQSIEEERLTNDDIVLESIMFWLRTDWFEKSLISHLNKKSLDYLLWNNFLREDEEKIFLWKNWYTLLDSIILELMK